MNSFAAEDEGKPVVKVAFPTGPHQEVINRYALPQANKTGSHTLAAVNVFPTPDMSGGNVIAAI